MKSEEDSPKKPYTTPKLTVYGDIRQITQTNPGGDLMDNNSKTARTG